MVQKAMELNEIAYGRGGARGGVRSLSLTCQSVEVGEIRGEQQRGQRHSHGGRRRTTALSVAPYC